MELARTFVASAVLLAGLDFGTAQAATIIVDLDATKGTGPFGQEIDAAPVSVTLGPGAYYFTVIDNTANGGYNGYNYNTGTTIRETYDVMSDVVSPSDPVFAIDKSMTGFSSYPDSATAIAAFASGSYGVYEYFPGSGATIFLGSAQPGPIFKLFAADTFVFAIPDNLFEDNTGGVSIAITEAVPEPETYALMLGGLGVLGFVGRLRKQA